ncbi:MAG: histidine phosphatase family protein [Pseudomonadota bacterium]
MRAAKQSMPIPELYVFRHGQTDWNAELRFQGQTDIPLNDHGRSQAQIIGQILKKLLPSPDGFDLLASPLSRAQETMKIALQTWGFADREITTEPEIIEVSYGDFEGWTLDELREDHSHLVDQRFADKWNFVPPGGESYAILEERIVRWLNGLSRPAIVACHGGVLRALQHTLMQKSADDVSAGTVAQDQVLVFDGQSTRWESL